MIYSSARTIVRHPVLSPRSCFDFPRFRHHNNNLNGSRHNNTDPATQDHLAARQGIHYASANQSLTTLVLSLPTRPSSGPAVGSRLKLVSGSEPLSRPGHLHRSGWTYPSSPRLPLLLSATSSSSSSSPWLSSVSRRSLSSSAVRLYAQPYFSMKNANGDTFRINLTKSRDFVGIRSTRCQRKYNQDRYKVLVLNPPSPSPSPMLVSGDATSSSNGSNGNNGNNTADKQPQRITQMDADQKTLFYFAIFDGHGGSHTADFLMAHLDEHIEQATPDMVPQVIRDLRKLGGYFRSFRPLFLEPFLPADFEDRYGSGKFLAEERARQRRKINVKGKGGQVKPMIFIPHPNATEEDQKQEVESLEHAAMGSSGEQGAQPSEHRGTPLNKDAQAAAVTTTAAAADTKRMEENKRDAHDDDHEDVYDADDDPFVVARRRHLNKTSPLPGGTTAYFGTDQSEYARLVVKHQDPETVKTETTQPEIPIPTTMTLEQRLCLSFLQCDTELIRNKYKDGSTASVVIVQSKGAFWDTPDDLDLLIAHVGDTRILLCEAPRGESIQLTTDHHPDAIVESERIRKMAAYVTADSFGENMFLGQVANTRALGDIVTKPYGVSAEPELVRRTVNASEAAFLVLISDGISSVMSNQEVVDCVKLEDDPTQAAANVLNLAEQLGAEDNCTVLVVKLPAWGKKMPDLSKELRDYRRQMEMQNSRARRQ